VDRELYRLLLAVGAEAGAMQVGKAMGVDPLLDAGDALIVDIDVADDVRDLVHVRIDALVLGQEADARDTEAMHFLLLHRGDLALEPGEAAARTEPVAHLAAVEV